MPDVAAPSYEDGQIIIFKGYSDSDVEPILEPGTPIRVVRTEPDGGLVVLPVAGGPGDTVFPEEVEAAEETVPATEEEPAPEPEKPAKKTRAKAEPKATVAKETTPVEPPVEVAARSSLTVVENTSGDAPSTFTVDDTEQVASLLENEDALAAAKNLAEQGNRTYLVLGGVLAHVYHEGAYRQAGYDQAGGFAAYVDKELGVSYRTAMYLINTYVTFRRLGIDENRLVKIGWSKAKELINYINEDNADELLERAANTTRDTLVEELRNERDAGKADMGDGTSTPGTQGEKLTLKLTFLNDQVETVKRALDAAKELGNTESDAVAFEYICGEWSILTASVEAPVELAIRQLETRYGVTVEVNAG